MRFKRWLVAAVPVILLAACDMESSLALENPYLTARLILALEQRGIEYRLAKDGAIHYPGGLEDAVEAARQQAYHARGETSAVIARPGQARMIVEQFDSVNIAYETRTLEHFVLIVWDYPRYRGADEGGAKAR